MDHFTPREPVQERARSSLRLPGPGVDFRYWRDFHARAVQALSAAVSVGVVDREANVLDRYQQRFVALLGASLIAASSGVLTLVTGDGDPVQVWVVSGRAWCRASTVSSASSRVTRAAV